MGATLGFDLGTSAMKGVLVSETGTVLHTARRPTALKTPVPGHCEFSLPDYYAAFCELCRELAAAVPSGVSIGSLGLSGATGSTVLLDAEGAPLHDAISWTDTRTANDPAVDPAGLTASDIYRVVGWPWFRVFPLAHLAWLRQHKPDTWRAARFIGMDLTYILFRLTGRWAMDTSTATNFYLQDQARGAWHSGLLAAAGLSETQLPALHASGTAVGALTATACRDTGLPADCLAALGAFDHPSAARGVGVAAAGDVLLSCGTSWVGFYPAPGRDRVLDLNLLCDPFLSPQGPWGAMFSLPKVGERVEAFVNERFAGEPTPARRLQRFNEAAEQSRSGDGEPCRAMMEQVAAEMTTRVNELAAAGLPARRIVMVGGPTRSAVWVNILRERLGRPIVMPEHGAYAGALGAARLAGAPSPDGST